MTASVVRGLLIAKAERDDTGVQRRRVRSEVAKAHVEGDEHPPLGDARRQYAVVIRAPQAFIGDGVRVMTGGEEQLLRRNGDVLVELDPHEPCESAWISCFASHAP